MKFREGDIERLNRELKIEEIVGEVVSLKKSGSNYKGLCPFHIDSNPSFMVSPNKNICKCFVCGGGGGPIKFYSDFKQITFSEAVKELAEKYNVDIKIEYQGKEKNVEYKEYYEVMNLVHEYYTAEIFKNTGRIALEYLTSRGLTPEQIKKNGIGYANNGAVDYLMSKGYGTDILITLGIAKASESNIYDAFRNRIMFPIHSLGKKVIAFGGRTLEKGKDVPKYINTPDTPIFKKGNILYGLGERSSIIKKKNYSILMEGYMDVLTSVIEGFDVTLAPLGTAFTEEQGMLLKKYTSNIILAFDMDGAGQKATEKTILTLKKQGFNIRVLTLTGAKDPDEYIKKYGKQSFLETIQNSEECFDFLYSYYGKEYDLNDMFSKQNFIKRFVEFFQNIDDKIEKTLYIDKLSTNVRIEKEILWETLVDKNKPRYSKPRVQEYEKENKEEADNEVEILTVRLILDENKYFKYFENYSFQMKFARKIIDYFKENYDGKKVLKLEEIIKLDTFEDEEKLKMIDFSLVSYNPYSQLEAKEMLFIELLSSWLRKDIFNYKNLIKQQDLTIIIKMQLALFLKSSEISLGEVKNSDDIIRIYEEFNKKINFFLMNSREALSEKVHK